MSACCKEIPNINVKDNRKKLVLAGNPNVGKSVFFNYLTGMYVDVSNFPGTTVDISTGNYKEYLVMDTPGVYGVSSFNDEETVARDVIIYGDIILNVVDALHLDRDLFLTQQIIDMGKKVVVALNMMDDIRKNNIDLDVELLSKELGVPVIPTTAVKREGLSQVSDMIGEARYGNKTKFVEESLEKLAFKDALDSEKLLALEEDEHLVERLGLQEKIELREKIYINRRRRVDEMIKNVIKEDKEDKKNSLGKLMIKPITGVPILMGVLYLAYLLIGVFVAQTVVGYTEEVLMGGYYYDFIMNLVGNKMNLESFWGQLLFGDFGILTMAPVYIIGLLTPLVLGFYFLLSILEDSGYLPRIATLVDRMMNKIGLNGRAIIPMILGFGCVTMATITTRILGSKRERFIATFLLGLTIPCSAQLGVIAGLVSGLEAKYIIIYSATMILVFGIAGVLLNKFLPGESTHLFIDIPPLRLPKVKNVVKKTFIKTWAFILEAGPLFVLGGVIITVLQYTKSLDHIIRACSPLTSGVLKLDPRVTQAFIMGIIRRDFGAAGLNDLVNQGILNPAQLTISLVVITLFVPCMAAILVIFKERSAKESIFIWVGSFVVSFLVGGILANLII